MDLKEEIVQIVTGANNVKVGDIIPIAKDGSELPGDVKIKKGMLRGVESCGMMCSIGELELTTNDYPDQIEDGIMILPKEYEKYLGEDIIEVLSLKEEIVEFEITSNRPDCFSVEGLGRETAATLKEEFKDPHKNLKDLNIEKVDELEGLRVDVEAPDLCYRYIARAVKNVKIGPSPEWMRRRLKACGVRAINNIVDITNYVMLEHGAPMHAFDINSIEGKHIIVRRAEENEVIVTLDEQERILNENNLVIADANKPVAIAGVMGGLNSEIEDGTNTVIFESAVFNGGSIRKTAKQIGLRTESSSRYEKGLSPENALKAVNRAVELVELIGAGEVVNKMIDVYKTKQEEIRISFRPEKINKLLGTELSKGEMVQILSTLDIKIENDYCIPPYYRMDLLSEADIAEEVLRIYGYDKLGSTLVSGGETIGGKNKEQKLEDRLKNLMVYSGYSETYSYSFLNERELEKSNISSNSKEIVHVNNPLGEDYSLMRISTIPSMMNLISTNYNKKNKDVKLFEMGKIYQDLSNDIAEDRLPKESKILSIASYGEGQEFYTLKGIVENILQTANVKRYELVSSKENRSFHTGRAAQILVGRDVIATFGEIHPIVLENYKVDEKVYFAEIDIEKLTKYGKENVKYTQIAKFPATERDIAIVVDEEVEVGAIEKVISKKCKKILEGLKLFDVYRSEKLGENKKSVAYSLRFRSEERTLTDGEISEVMETITKDLERELGAELRK